MTADRDYPEMAATRGRIEPAPRRVRGYLGHELVFDTTAARYVWEIPYYPAYYVPLADVRTGIFARREPSAEGAARPVAAALPGRRRSDPPVGRAGVRRRRRQPRRRHRAIRMGTAALVRGGRADLRPPAQSLFAGGRAALASARSGRAGRSLARRHPNPCARSSKPVYPPGITSIRPMSTSNIWNSARRRRCARTKG